MLPMLGCGVEFPGRPHLALDTNRPADLLPYFIKGMNPLRLTHLVKCLLPLLLSVAAGVGCQSSRVEISIDPDVVIKDVRNHPLGTTPPLLVTDQAKTAAAVAQLGTRYLRFGDQRYSFWSEPPWNSAKPVTIQRGPRAWPAGEREWVQPDGIHFRPDRTTDFDQYMALAKATGSLPLVITSYNGWNAPAKAGVVTPPKEAFFRATVEQVRYANLAKKYRITYWEIGNELWNPKEGGVHTAAEVAADLKVLVPRMKQVDPTIRVMLSGNKLGWYRQLLTAAPQIDDICFSWYLPPSIEGYDDFRRTNSLLSRSQEYVDLLRALDELDAPTRSRIGIVISEFNAIDWDGRWPNTNDLGHALCVFQQAGEAMSNPRIKLAIHWTMQWNNPHWTVRSDDASVFNAVRQDGSLAANGLALSLWGRNLLDEFISATSTGDHVLTWATRSGDGHFLNVFVLNKDYTSNPLSLTIETGDWTLNEITCLSGQGIDDPRPTLSPLPTRGSIEVPPASVTLLKYHRNPARKAP